MQRVRASLRRSIPDPQPHVLVGYSGGRDSLALSIALADLAQAGALTAELLHVDHAARPASAEAVPVVRAVAATLSLPVRVVRLDADRVASHTGVGREEALRRERYRAFAHAVREAGAAAVALAHHQRDQAETVLLHLLRGAGLDGAAGMREWTRLQVPWWPDPTALPASLAIWRPLLGERFEDVVAVADGSGYPVVEDETNVDRSFRRNAIRHDVLPVLECVVPGATAALARFGMLAAADNAVLEALAAEALARARTGDGERLDRNELCRLAPPLQRRVVRGWLRSAGYAGELPLHRVDAVLGLAARHRSGARIEIGEGWSVTLSAGLLALER